MLIQGLYRISIDFSFETHRSSISKSLGEKCKDKLVKIILRIVYKRSGCWTAPQVYKS